jgi:hypothetical protein
LFASSRSGPRAKRSIGRLGGFLPRNPKHQRFWGVKALAQRQEESPDLIDEAYDLRNDLFHAEAGVLDDLVRRAEGFGNRLEALLAPGLLIALGLEDAVDELPTIASSNHATRLTVRGRLRGDPTQWGDGVNPHVDVTFATEGVGERAKGKARGTFAVQNADGLDGPIIELSGPEGGQTSELSSSRQLR